VEEKLRELGKLQENYIKWAKEIVQANPSLRGHWVKTMGVIESEHQLEIARMIELLEDFIDDSDKDGTFMALINKAETEK
jgi:hypothetical protein